MSDDTPLLLPKSFRQVKPVQACILTSDPATFLIAMAVVNHVRDSVSEMRKWLVEQRPELEVVLDSVLASMQQAGWIEIVDDRLLVLPEALKFDMRDAGVANSVHGVATAVMKRVHNNLMTDPAANPADNMAWIALPDHPKVRRRLMELARQYKAGLSQLSDECSDNPEIKGDQCRFAMILSGPIRPEDY